MGKADNNPGPDKRSSTDYTKYGHYDLSILMDSEKRVLLAKIQHPGAKNKEIAQRLEMGAGSFSVILNRAKSKLDGTFDYDAHKKKRRTYIENHFDKIRKRQKKYNEEHKEDIKKWKHDYAREYYKNNKDKFKAYNHDYYEKNREWIKERQKERDEKHKEK